MKSGPAPARRLARALGELLFTAGAVLVLFGIYHLVWTNLESVEAQQALAADLSRTWDRPAATAGDPAPRQPQPPRPGAGLALLHIPRLGTEWVQPVLQGVGAAELARGLGHYAQTALPGQVGNFAVAGHRATHGEPLRHLDRLRGGDTVVVETSDTWFTYAVLGPPVVVASTATEAIGPVPGNTLPTSAPKEPGEPPTERLLTLTTCHPRWSSEKRMIVHATLVEERPRAAGSPPALARGA